MATHFFIITNLFLLLQLRKPVTLEHKVSVFNLEFIYKPYCKDVSIKSIANDDDILRLVNVVQICTLSLL